MTKRLNAPRTARLVSVEYFEHPRSAQLWGVLNCEFGQVNLIVGKNATGKSRLLKLLANLARLLTGIQREPFGTSHWHVELEIDSKRFSYWLQMEGRGIIFEQLSVDGVRKFRRDSDGRGSIYAEELRTDLKFQVEQNVVVALAKIDAVQHPYLVQLNEWASGVRLFEFGTPLGRDSLLMPPEFVGSGAPARDRDVIMQTSNTVGVVRQGLELGPEFKARLLDDLSAFGFPCTDVGVGQVPGVDAPAPLLGVYVEERGLPFRNYQILLSQGFFRALALMASINLFAIRGDRRTLLVDDIGEGLDFDRASAVIKRLLQHAKAANLQILMTSNDRFIMNSVPLECWTVLDRNKWKVTPFNVKNAKPAFEKFARLGLSNFDFFATGSYRDGIGLAGRHQ